MAEYRPVVITNEGQRVLFKAINGKYRLKFTSMAFGSGSYESSDTGVNLTALKREKQRVDIQKIKTQNDTTVIIQSNVSNKDITEGYYLTEVGIYVKNADDESSGETLYAVAIATVPDFMSAYNGTVPLEFILSFYITVNNAADVTIEAIGSPMAYLDEVYTKEESKLRFGLAESVTFDKNYVPLTTSSDTSLSTGKFATGNTSIKYVYIPSSVTSVSSGTFYGCTNLTDIYVDNTEDNIIFHTPNHIPSTAKIHYLDNFNANGYIIKALLNLVKTGSGNLNDDSLLSIRYASYTYQQIGNVVTLEVHTYINPDQTIGNLRFNNIPAETQNQYTGICISSTNAIYKWTIENSTLEISKLDASQWIHDNGEEFRFVVTYEV